MRWQNHRPQTPTPTPTPTHARHHTHARACTHTHDTHGGCHTPTRTRNKRGGRTTVDVGDRTPYQRSSWLERVQHFVNMLACGVIQGHQTFSNEPHHCRRHERLGPTPEEERVVHRRLRVGAWAPGTYTCEHPRTHLQEMQTCSLCTIKYRHTLTHAYSTWTHRWLCRRRRRCIPSICMVRCPSPSWDPLRQAP
jgi:hypothetical protein